MSPAFMENDAAHLRLSDSEYMADRNLAGPMLRKFANSADLIGCKFDFAMSLAEWALMLRVRLPAFLDHVQRVVGWQAKKQVIRANAWRIVAVMTDQQAWWDWAVGQLPCNAGCYQTTPFRWSATDNAVPAFTTVAFPQPARVGLDYFCPEPFGKRAASEIVGIREVYGARW